MTEIIDAKGKLNHGKIKKFALSDNPEIIATIAEIKLTKTLLGDSTNSKLRYFFTNAEIAEEIKAYSNSLVIQFTNMTDNVLLEFQKVDYSYWTKPGRLEKLLGETIVEQKEETKKEKKEKTEVFTIPVACAVRDTQGYISNIKTFTGTQKEVITFLNDNAGDLQVKFYDTATVVYNIAYQSKDELSDENNWYTFDELVEAGVFGK